MAYRCFTIAIAVSLVAAVYGEDSTFSILGAQTAGGILASGANGMAQYFDQNGPIQPAVIALGTLPARGAEQLNKGLSRLSSGFYGQAQSLSQSNGQNGQIQMPGLQRATAQIPDSMSQIGQRIRDGIRRKNEWIMERAQDGIDSINRSGEKMRTSLRDQSDNGLSVSAPSPLSGVISSGQSILDSARNSLTSGASQLQSQAQQQISGLQGQMAPIGSFGQDLAGQLGQYSKTIADGVRGAAGEIQQSGQQLMNQMQTNHPKNLQTISQMMSSMSSSLRSNLGNLARQARNMGQSAINQARSFGRGGSQRAQDASRMAQDLGRETIRRAENLGQGAAQQAQNLGQSAAQQAQAFGRSASQQFQNLGQEAAQQAQTFGRSASQQAQNLGQSSLNQAQSAAQQAQALGQSAINQAQSLGQGAMQQAENAAQQLSNGIRSIVP